MARFSRSQPTRPAPAQAEGPDVLQAEVIDSDVLQAELVSLDAPRQINPPCPTCGAPRDGDSKFCSACGAPLDARDVPVVGSGGSGSGADALPNHTFQCQNCGSEVATSLEQRSYVCPFCDSAYVAEIPVARSNRQRPEFVVGFAVTAQQAEQKFFEWLGKNAWFRPGDLALKAVSEKQRGVYLPFWHFSVDALSRWSAGIGEYWYRTEHYQAKDANGKTVTKSRQVRETEWFSLRGRHRRYYSGYLVPASKGITPQESRAIQPFQLGSLARYRPYFLAGWMAEEYSVPMQAAIEETQAEFERRQEKAIKGFLPGDTHRDITIQTESDITGSDLVLLPVHVLSYRYRDQVYRFLVNGQTGKVVGQKPWSGRRVALLVAGILLAIALAVVAMVLLGNR